MLLEPKAFIWCIAGPHVNETLAEIVTRKQSDIARFGWCLWAYGGGGNAHPEIQVRRLAHDYANGATLSLLMPNTGVESPVGVEFTGFRAAQTAASTPLPSGMTPVTGGKRSWAFRLTGLSVVEAHVDVAAYVAPFATKGVTPLPEYLRGAHGRACAARRDGEHQADVRAVAVVGELAEPYAVFLARA